MLVPGFNESLTRVIPYHELCDRNEHRVIVPVSAIERHHQTKDGSSPEISIGNTL